MALQIEDFAVVIRNIVDVGKPQEPFHVDAIVNALEDILPPESEWFSVTKTVADRVCSMAKRDMARMELPTVEIVDRPKIFLFDDDKVAGLFEKKSTPAKISVALHRSGVLLVNMHLRFEKKDGISVGQAIEATRINLRTLAMKLPGQLSGLSLPKSEHERARYFSNEKGTFFVGTFKDLATDVIRPLFISRLKDRFALKPIRERRCIASTLVQIYRTNPPCESIEDFVTPERFGKEILGIATLDKSYHTRSESAVVESFSNNLSTDEETGVYTFVLSDLILFDNSVDDMIEDCKKKKGLGEQYSAMLYFSTHFSCLLEWVYLEKYLIDLYNRMLSKVAAQEDTSPKEMLRIQKESMHDLIGYKEGITPYPSREDFWEKARVGHRILEAQEKLEKKRDLATDYVLQEYTLRTNSSIQLVNFFISATAAFGLMEVILSIFQNKGSKLGWGIATGALFTGMLILLWAMNKIFLAVAKKKD